MSDQLETLVKEMDEDITCVRARFAGLARRLAEVTRQRDWAEVDLEDRRQSFEIISERFTEKEQELRLVLQLLQELRPIVERAHWVFSPPKGDITWGAVEQQSLLDRIDAFLPKGSDR